jgi:transcriptional regulator with XRE-family HTH domain
MRRSRAPNNALRALLVQANWSGEDLARAVNAAGRESGADLHYQRASVSQWLAGIRPRSPATELIAEVLGRRLGRDVTTVEAGLAAPDQAADEPAVGGELWRRDTSSLLDGEVEERLRTYSLAGLDAPAFGLHSAGWVRGRIEDRRRCDPLDVACAEAMLTVFSGTDLVFGGGYGRQALTAYLRRVLSPQLALPASSGVRRQLLQSAARLTYLCGFMHFDDRLNGSAQHYYQLSLRLADEAADPIAYATALRGLSTQAQALGHFQSSAQLALHAVRTGWRCSPAHVRAFLAGQLAVSAAALGRHEGAADHLHRAESALDRAGEACGPRPVAAFHLASLDYQRALLASAHGDVGTAISALGSSLRRRPQDERRSRALSLARIAELHLSCGHLDAACTEWTRFLDEYPYLTSRRVDAAFSTMRASVRPHVAHRPAAVLFDRAAALRGTHAG